MNTSTTLVLKHLTPLIICNRVTLAAVTPLNLETSTVTSAALKALSAASASALTATIA
jgi:hypothetical protein